MRRVIWTVFVVLAFAGLAYAHGGNEHVRGTVKEVSATSIIVQTTGDKTATVKLDAKTMFMKGGKHLAMTDLKVGDRVVVDVSEETHIAESVTIGAAAKADAHK